MARHHHSVGDEATSAGLLGATTVAVWFLLLDFLAGRPLHIASVLGQVLLFGDRTPDLVQLHWGAVELYGFFHFLSFLAVGWLAVRLLHMAIREPVWLVALLLLFVCLENIVFAVSYPAVPRHRGRVPAGAGPHRQRLGGSRDGDLSLAYPPSRGAVCRAGSAG